MHEEFSLDKKALHNLLPVLTQAQNLLPQG